MGEVQTWYTMEKLKCQPQDTLSIIGACMTLGPGHQTLTRNKRSQHAVMPLTTSGVETIPTQLCPSATLTDRLDPSDMATVRRDMSSAEEMLKVTKWQSQEQDPPPHPQLLLPCPQPLLDSRQESFFQCLQWLHVIAKCPLYDSNSVFTEVKLYELELSASKLW